MAGGAVIASLGIGLMTLVQSPWQVFIVYGLIYGLGNAGIANPTVGVMISRWFERGRGMAVSAANSGSSAGSLVIIVLFAAAISSAGWRTAYLWLGAANLFILFPLVLFAVRSRPNNAQSNMEAGGRSDSSEAQQSSGISTESAMAIVRSKDPIANQAAHRAHLGAGDGKDHRQTHQSSSPVVVVSPAAGSARVSSSCRAAPLRPRAAMKAI